MPANTLSAFHDQENRSLSIAYSCVILDVGITLSRLQIHLNPVQPIHIRSPFLFTLQPIHQALSRRKVTSCPTFRSYGNFSLLRLLIKQQCLPQRLRRKPLSTTMQLVSSLSVSNRNYIY